VVILRAFGPLTHIAYFSLLVQRKIGEKEKTPGLCPETLQTPNAALASLPAALAFDR